MKSYWFKIWCVGNGGIPSEPKYVFWPDLSYLDKSDYEDEMEYMIQRELGPYSSGIRSSNWERTQPPQYVVEQHIKDLQAKIRFVQEEIEIHRKQLEENQHGD